MTMEILCIQSSEDTPSIILDAASGKFEVALRSLPEDAATFYAPVLEWMMQYAKSPNEKTEFKFNLEYFNTSSAKQIFKLLNILEQIAKQKTMRVLWCYDKGDEDMLASGQRFSKLTELKFEMRENA